MTPREYEELLLDLHLGRLDPEFQARMAEELETDPQLKAKSDKLGGVLRPLDFWHTSTPPADLEQRILDRVSAVRKSRELVSAGAAGAGGGGSRGFVFRFRDVLAVAACLTLLTSVMVPGISAVRRRAEMTQCARNLAAIHSGTAQYATDFSGSLPFAGSVRGAAWLPSGAHDRPFASNSRHVFRLLKTEYVPEAKSFVCPSSPDGVAMARPRVARREDFATEKNFSYASLNLGGVNPNLRPTASLAIMSDQNPLFAKGRFDSTMDATVANSAAHDNHGQTVLTLDGHVEMMRTPIVGIGQDNLWLVNGLRTYNGTEVQTQRDDAFLIPGFSNGTSKSKAY